MATPDELNAGIRVRLHSPSHALTLRVDTGHVVRKDRWADYYVIRLDQPALYHHADGTIEEITEICESADNVDVISSDLVPAGTIRSERPKRKTGSTRAADGRRGRAK